MKQAKILSDSLSAATTSASAPLSNLSTESTASLIAHAADLLAALMVSDTNLSVAVQDEVNKKKYKGNRKVLGSSSESGDMATRSLTDSDNAISELHEIEKLSNDFSSLHITSSYGPASSLNKADVSASHGEWNGKVSLDEKENLSKAAAKYNTNMISQTNTNINYSNYHLHHCQAQAANLNVASRKIFDHNSGSGSNCCFVKLLATQLVAGTIIGKGGKGLNWFRRKSGVEEIYLSMPWEVYPGTDQRVILLQGNQNAIVKGLNVIVDVIKDKMELLSKERLGTVPVEAMELCLRLVIPPTSVVLIKGINGEKLRLAQKKKCASINIVEAPQAFNQIQFYPDEKICEVSGNCNELRVALETIAVLIQSDIHLRQYNFVSYINNKNCTNDFTIGNNNRKKSVEMVAEGLSDDENQQYIDAYFFNSNRNNSQVLNSPLVPSLSDATGPHQLLFSSSSTLSNAVHNLSLTQSLFPIEDSVFMKQNNFNSTASPRYSLHNNSFTPSSCKNETEMVTCHNNSADLNIASNNNANRGSNNNTELSKCLPQSGGHSFKLCLTDLAEILKNRIDILNHFTVVSTQIPASSVGNLVGVNGCWVQEIQKLSAATVNVLRDLECQSSLSQYRTLQISGTLEAVYSAFALCIGRILNGQKVNTVEEDNFSSQVNKPKHNQFDRRSSSYQTNLNDNNNLNYMSSGSITASAEVGVASNKINKEERVIAGNENEYREYNLPFSPQFSFDSSFQNEAVISLHYSLPSKNITNSCGNNQSRSLWNNDMKINKHYNDFTPKGARSNDYNSGQKCVVGTSDEGGCTGFSDTEEFLKTINLRRRNEQQKNCDTSAALIAVEGNNLSAGICESCEEQDDNLLSVHEYVSIADFL